MSTKLIGSSHGTTSVSSGPVRAVPVLLHRLLMRGVKCTGHWGFDQTTTHHHRSSPKHTTLIGQGLGAAHTKREPEDGHCTDADKNWLLLLVCSGQRAPVNNSVAGGQGFHKDNCCPDERLQRLRWWWCEAVCVGWLTLSVGGCGLRDGQMNCMWTE